MELAKYESFVIANNNFMKRLRNTPNRSRQDEHDIVNCAEQTRLFGVIIAAYKANDIAAVEAAKENLEAWTRVCRTASYLGAHNM
jgi:hypothetical protein